MKNHVTFGSFIQDMDASAGVLCKAKGPVPRVSDPSAD